MADNPNSNTIDVDSGAYLNDPDRFSWGGDNVTPVDSNFGFVPTNPEDTASNLKKSQANIQKRFYLK